MTENKVTQWYNEHVELEDKCLISGNLQYEITLHYIREAIASLQRPEDPAKGLHIADIGCGTGVYAIPLAQDGHRVSISDISSASANFAVQKAQAANLHFVTSSAFDARSLRSHSEIYKPNHYSLVLLPGPLYHILDEDERCDVLLSALEIVKPGGYVLAAFVTRNAHLRDIAVRDPGRLAREWGFYERYLRDGRYTRGGKAPMYHASLKEIRALVATARRKGQDKGIGSELGKLVSCEGFLGFQHASHLVELDEDAFARWREVVLGSAADEATLGAADHILAVIRRTS
ncbi:hypothetical protein PRZ48_010439 [Zasmidium cellare]|uniref:Methyltransferase domain-containing protein n=1 Tax=Zasmidium cellare TaxID=395010 RepID=A0ABR0E996_ZASCE|nr:hypothetical protein PRZ48_010439 [Zasmidium cellare]